MKKHINIIILVLLLLDIVFIYFSFIGFKERSKELEIAEENSIVKEISVDCEVIGNPFAQIKITDISKAESNINAVSSSLGTAFDISGNFGNIQLQEATVSLKYDREKLPEGISEDDLGILWYDEENNKMVEMSSQVDKNEQTVTFTTEHFSQYIFIDIKKWHETWAKQVAKIRDTKEEFSVAFVIDDSGSMASNDPQDKRIDAAKQAVSSLTTDDRYAIIKFESDSETLQDFTNHPEDAQDDYDEFESSGGTDIGGAVEETIELLKEEDKDRNKIILLLTDGEDTNLSSEKDELVQQANDLGIVIFGIGLEANTNSKLNFDVFSNLATETTGKFYRINETGLTDIFTEITSATVGIDGTVDSDQDGIPDGLETAGMRDQFGNIIKTNPYMADTDGDGKSDREEIGELKSDENGNIYYERISDPLVNESSDQVKRVDYHLGPQEDAKKENVWDSGFRTNVNALPFKNFALIDKAEGGVCEGFSIITERVFNGNFERKAKGLFGEYDLTERKYDYIFNSKNLYTFVPTSEKLKTYLSRTVEDAQILNEDMEDGKDDNEIIKSIYYNWRNGNFKKEENILSIDHYKYRLLGYKITEKTMNNLKNTFKNDKEIVTVQIGNHAVNGYALEKLSENVYFLYVYDNNYPYDPLSINQKNSMMATRNNLIILRRIEEKYFGTTSTKYRAEYYGALYFNDNDEIDEKVNEIDLFLSNEYFKEYIDESKSDNKYHSVTDDVQIHKDYETLN